MKIEDVVESEGHMLAELRAKAMQSSLEEIGRFEESRVRSRFLEAFIPAKTKKITIDGKTVGFYVISQKEDHIYLDHLYVEPDFQGLGIGARIISTIKTIATEKELSIH